MNAPAEPSPDGLRRGVYWLLIAVAAGGMVGRILAVNSIDRMGAEKVVVSRKLDERKKELAERGLTAEEIRAQTPAIEQELRAELGQQRPFLSGNDRSRWATARALVEHGTFAIDAVVEEPNWDTIDMVKHNGKLYSSKPPLLEILIAGEYWLIHNITRRTLGTHPYEIGRFMLLTINVLPLVVGFVALSRLLDRFGATDWGRLFAFATACFGTFLSTFAVAINNHLIGAVSALLAVAAAVPIWCDEEKRGKYFFAAGFFAAFAAANELPALSLLGLLGLLMLWKDPLRTLGFGLPGVALVAAAFLGTNYWAFGTFRPPYDHRSDGPVVYSVPDVGGALVKDLDADLIPQSIRPMLETAAGEGAYDGADLEIVVPGERWVATLDPHRDTAKFALVRDEADRIEVRAWDNWYDYTFIRGGRVRDSYWRPSKVAERSPVDRGEPSPGTYALHALVGHHGLFSLTPVWLLTVAGGVMALRQPRGGLRAFAIVVGLSSLVCLAFYLGQEQENRNYGGTSSGLRWMFWFALLWTLVLLPAADWLSARRWGRVAALLLLGWSAMSVSYPTWNPWTHPWLVNLMNYLEWTRI